MHNYLLVFSTLLLAVVVPMSCKKNSQSRAQQRFEILTDSISGETLYKSIGDSCTITMTVYSSPVNKGILRYRNECNFDPVRDMPEVKAILSMLSCLTQLDSIHTLSWGRLTSDLSKPSVLSLRLAAAALNSSFWDISSGRPSVSGKNEFVRNLINDQNIFSELRLTLQEYGFDLQVTSVEKVLIYRAGKLPDFVSLQTFGIKETDFLPVDAQIWFKLNRIIY